MPLRTIGTGDGWDVTDSGIYVPDWARAAGRDLPRPARGDAAARDNTLHQPVKPEKHHDR